MPLVPEAQLKQFGFCERARLLLHTQVMNETLALAFKVIVRSSGEGERPVEHEVHRMDHAAFTHLLAGSSSIGTK